MQIGEQRSCALEGLEWAVTSWPLQGADFNHRSVRGAILACFQFKPSMSQNAVVGMVQINGYSNTSITLKYLRPKSVICFWSPSGAASPDQRNHVIIWKGKRIAYARLKCFLHSMFRGGFLPYTFEGSIGFISSVSSCISSERHRSQSVDHSITHSRDSGERILPILWKAVVQGEESWLPVISFISSMEMFACSAQVGSGTRQPSVTWASLCSESSWTLVMAQKLLSVSHLCMSLS